MYNLRINTGHKNGKSKRILVVIKCDIIFFHNLMGRLTHEMMAENSDVDLFME
jgi:hypothetical protein